MQAAFDRAEERPVARAAHQVGELAGRAPVGAPGDADRDAVAVDDDVAALEGAGGGDLGYRAGGAQQPPRRLEHGGDLGPPARCAGSRGHGHGRRPAGVAGARQRDQHVGDEAGVGQLVVGRHLDERHAGRPQGRDEGLVLAAGRRGIDGLPAGVFRQGPAKGFARGSHDHVHLAPPSWGGAMLRHGPRRGQLDEQFIKRRIHDGR